MTPSPNDPDPQPKLTHDFPDAHHDPGDADQAFGRRSELGGRADAGPVDAAVEGQLQAWRASSELSPAHLQPGSPEFRSTYRCTPCRGSGAQWFYPSAAARWFLSRRDKKLPQNSRLIPKRCRLFRGSVFTSDLNQLAR